MNRHSFIKALCLTLLFWSAHTVLLAQITTKGISTTTQKVDLPVFSSHVQDKQTGEPLPFVNVYIASGIGTMSNIDGDFSIKADKDTELRISYIGYETLVIKAGELPKTIKLVPATNALQEVVVMPIDYILKKVEQKLSREYSRKKSKTNQYFYRQLVSRKGDELTAYDELAEAFLLANSAVNLRNLTFLSGRHGRATAMGLARPLIASMNFHHPLELGPMMKDNIFWWETLRPFNCEYAKRYSIKNPYSYSIENIEFEGRKAYRIKMQPNDNITHKHFLVGHMDVDAENYELLDFDGKVTGLQFNVIKDLININSSMELNIHIKYRHTHDFTEIENLTFSLRSGDLYANAILYNVEGLDLAYNKKKIKIKKRKVSENMLSNIDDDKFETILKQNADIVKRTDDEAETALTDDIRQKHYLFTRYNVKGGKNKKWTLELPDNALGNHVNRLAKIGQVIPQEKVYVHMDNTSYFLGDSIWYSAYLRRTNDDQLSSISGILYVELLNNDGYVMERQMIETKDGYGHGAFHINPDWYAGYYEIRAYTRWQLNWGVTEREHSTVSKDWFINKEMHHKYFTDYEKLYSRVFPVYDAPRSPGKYAENMTLRELVHYTKKDPDRPKLQVKLYPEGGELINGIPCRIAFEASYTDGMFAKGNLYIDNGKGKDPTVIPTVNRGRGVFTITPIKEMSREVRFVTTGGDKATAKFPKSENDGVAMNIQRHDSLWTIKVDAAGMVDINNLGLTIMHEGRVRYFFELNDTSKVFTISNNELENGINQATVFDTKGNVYADRLFFVTRPELTKRALTITGLKDEYKPYEQVNLDISLDTMLLADIGNKRSSSSGFISLAVRDTETSNLLFDNASMQAEMLLSSEIRGFVPSPDWFFEKDDTEHQQALDLLMMTQGWRRFDWRQMAVRGEWELTQPDERTPIIIGKLYSYDPVLFYNPKDTKNAYNNYLLSAATDMSKPDSQTSKSAGNGLASQFNPNSQDEFRIQGPYADFINMHRNNRTAIKPSVFVHAELVDAVTKEVATAHTQTDGGKFRITMPKFYDTSVFFLTASDVSKWKSLGNIKDYTKIQDYMKENELAKALDLHNWVETMPDFEVKRKYRPQVAEFSIRVDQPFPRFAKPYSYYQQNLDFSDDGTMGEKTLDDGTHRLAEIKVRAKRRGYRAVNDTLPALIVDAYDAYNFALDAGMTTSNPKDILRAYVGDYGLKRPYVINGDGQHDFRLRTLYGGDIVARAVNDKTLNMDSVALRRNLYNNRAVADYLNSSMEGSMEGVISYWDAIYGDLTRIDKYAIYTDFHPRRIGSSRYFGSNLPYSYISIIPFADDSRRKYYRDRRFVFDGIATVAEFYQPDYSNNRLPEQPDHRRTLYWNPHLLLDANGKASVSFWNNSSAIQLKVSAEGMGNNGQAIGN